MTPLGGALAIAVGPAGAMLGEAVARAVDEGTELAVATGAAVCWEVGATVLGVAFALQATRVTTRTSDTSHATKPRDVGTMSELPGEDRGLQC